MLIDSNTYTGHWPFKQLKYNSCEALLGRMNQFGVEASLISNLNGIFYKNTQPANEELYQEIRSNKKFGNRFIPFAVINPIYNGWKDDMEDSISKLGMKGIRLYPTYHGYELTNPACIELVKTARDRGLPVAFSLRMVDSRPSSWLDLSFKEEWKLKDIIPIIKAVPDAKYLLLNIANSTALTEEETKILRNANILFDTSGRMIYDFPALLNQLGKDKFVFGTHAPILDSFTGLLRVESLRESEADEKSKEGIRSGNIKRFLGI